MPSRDFADRIRDMLSEITEIQQFVAGTSFEQFCQDRRTLKAVLYGLAVIGEATAKILPEVETSHPKIPWIDIRGMRNIAIHEYFQLDLEIIWTTVQDDLPTLKIVLDDILRDAQEDNVDS
ncbi:MAG: DUF86 domain-containing protein [Cyanobacteria bacterium P01_F01_bin.56]